MKVIHPWEVAMPLMNPGNSFVSNPSLVCLLDFGLYRDLVQMLKSTQRKCVFINLISLSSKEFGVSMISLFYLATLTRPEDHGDHIIITSSKCGNGGGLIMLGRSDGVLYVLIHSSPRQSSNSFHRNPGGIRFGSAEIYEVLDLYFSSQNAEHVILDYLAVGQKTDGGADERVVLFIKLPPGQDLSPTFEARIKSVIRSCRSPRHVPARV